MSPRAAWRLERLGYTAYDYTAGKVDWIAAGLPSEGRPHPPRGLGAGERDPVRCAPDEPVATVVARLDERGTNVCVVVDDHDIVLGRLRRDHVDAADTHTADEVMEPGPPTVRAHDPLQESLDRMAERHVRSLLVTSPSGVLLGELRADPTAIGH
jgi:CBS domain-containing protein